MELPLKRGTYISKYFSTKEGVKYHAGLSWDKFLDRDTYVKLDWEILDESGTVLGKGALDSQMGEANGIYLGEIERRTGRKARIVVNVDRDVDGPDSKPQLTIEPPDISLDIAEGYYPAAVVNALIFCCAGGIMLMISKKNTAATVR
jgi:hypothetical protein